MPPAFSDDAKRILDLIDNVLKSCAWVSWVVVDTDKSSKKQRVPITSHATQARGTQEDQMQLQQRILKIQSLLQGPKLEEIREKILSLEIISRQKKTSAFIELCSYETSEQTELRIKNANVTTAPFDAFGSLIDMLRSFAEGKVEPEMGSAESKKHIASTQELKKIDIYLETMTACLAKALMDVWAVAAVGDEAQKEKERKISVILHHLTCHGALGWTDGNMPFVYTCVHPAQSHYTTGAAQNIMQAVDRKQLSKVLVKLSTIGVIYDGREGSEVPYILEFSSFLLRQLIVTLSIPKDLMQSYREVLRFMIDLVREQQSGAEFEHKSNILYPLIRGIIFHYPRDTRNSRGGIDDVFWTSGLIEEILDLVHNDNEAENSKVDKFYRLSAMTSIFSLTRVVEFRVPLRDKGMLDVILNAYYFANQLRKKNDEWDEKVSDMLMNMAERDEIKNSLKNTEVFQLLKLFVDTYPEETDASRLFALIAIAHIWGADDNFEDVATDEAKARSQDKSGRVFEKTRTLDDETFSSSIVQRAASAIDMSKPLETDLEREIRLKDKDDQMKAESKVAGRLLKENKLGKWLFQKLGQAIKEGTATIVAAGFTIFLNVEDIIHAIQSFSSNKEAARIMGQRGLFAALVRMLKGDRARDPEDNNREVLIKTLTSIQNLTEVKELRDHMEEKAEMKGALKDLAEKLPDEQRIQVLVKGVLSNFSRNFDKAESMEEVIKNYDSNSPPFDVFLSHKRTDAKDFCRGLHTLFQANGITCFLDYEFREELSQLETIVSRCKNLIFVLTENVFDSDWCKRELQAAALEKKNIILVVKDGSRWIDANGSNTLTFPSQAYINLLPPEAQTAFVSKAVYHSDEYYTPFTDELLRRIKREPAQPGKPCEVAPAAGMGRKNMSQFDLTSAWSGSLQLDSSHVDELVASSEQSLKVKIFGTERALVKQIDCVREQIDDSEQSLARKLSTQVHTFSELVQDIENRLSTKLEKRLREVRDEVKDEVRATTREIKDAIASLGSVNGSRQSAGGAQPPQARYVEDPSEAVLPSQLQRQAETGNSLMAAGRSSRLFSTRPHSGSPAHRSPNGSQGGLGVGSGLAVKGLNRSPYN